MAFHEYLLQILHLGWLALPFPIYLIIKKNYLDSNQMYLLLLCSMQLIGLMFTSNTMQCIRIIVNTFYCLVILDLCLLEFEDYGAKFHIDNFLRNKSNRMSKRSSQNNSTHLKQLLRKDPSEVKMSWLVKHYKTLKNFKLDETFIIPLAILVWIFIHAHFSKSYTFGVNSILYDGSIFQGFSKTLDGWNCTFPQFYSIPILWISILLFCMHMLHETLSSSSSNIQKNQQNEYKSYLLKYLIKPSFLIFFIDLIFNLIVHISVDGLLQCYFYFKNLIVFQFVSQWSIPCITLIFFMKKSGKFKIIQKTDENQRSSSSSHSMKSNQEEEEFQRKYPNLKFEWELKQVQSYEFKNI